MKKDYLLGGGVYYYNEQGDWEDYELGAIGMEGVGIINGVRLKGNVYPH